MARIRHALAVFAASSRFRFGPTVGAACLLALTAVGCRTTQNPSSNLNGTRGALGSAAKTDFSAEATADQGFNLHMELGRVRASESNFEAAISEYMLALEISEKKGSMLTGAKLGPEKQALAHRRTAESFDQLGRFAEADVHYTKALKLAPRDPKVWNSAGYSYYIQHRLPDAERCLKMASSFDPTDPKIQTNLGLTLAAAGKTDDALTALTKAGGPAVGQANLGFILAAMGKKADARKHYETAITLQPELKPAQIALAHLDSGTKDAAVAIASNSAPAPPTAPEPEPAPAPDPAPVRTPPAIPDIVVKEPAADVVSASPLKAHVPIPVPVPIAVGTPSSTLPPIPEPISIHIPAPAPKVVEPEPPLPPIDAPSPPKTTRAPVIKATRAKKRVKQAPMDPQIMQTSTPSALVPPQRTPNTIPKTPW